MAPITNGLLHTESVGRDAALLVKSVVGEFPKHFHGRLALQVPLVARQLPVVTRTQRHQ